MKNRLPVYIEERELPKNDEMIEKRNSNSYGYVSILYILYILSLIITGISVLVVLGIRK